MRQVFPFELAQKQTHKQLSRQIDPLPPEVLHLLPLVGLVITQKARDQSLNHVAQHLSLLLVAEIGRPNVRQKIPTDECLSSLNRTAFIVGIFVVGEVEANQLQTLLFYFHLVLVQGMPQDLQYSVSLAGV